MDPITSIVENAKINDENARVVAAHVVGYFTAMHELEKTNIPLAKRRHTQQEFDEAVARQVAVFREYWDAGDDYWAPVDIGSEARFNPDGIKDLAVVTDGNGSFIVTLTYEIEDAVMANRRVTCLVSSRDGAPKIVNEFY